MSTTSPDTRPFDAESSLLRKSAPWPVVWRFAWKEYRQMRGFWFALLGLALATMPMWWLNGGSPTQWFFTTAWIGAALYAVAAASTQFACEQEEGTHGFLQGLPLSWPPLFLGKLLAAAAGTLMMLALLLVAGYFAAGRQLPPRVEMHAVLTILGPVLLEGLAWGTFFSLILGRPLLAAILAMVAASLGVAVLSGLFAPGAPLFLLEAYRQSMIPRILLSCGILLIDLLLARDWLTAGSPSQLAETLIGRLSLRRRHISLLAETKARARHASQPHVRPAWRVQLRRLVWQTWRESRWTMAVLAVVAMPFGFAWLNAITTVTGETSQLDPAFAAYTFAGPLLIPIALWGGCVYLADHRNHQVRFLAEHGARSRYVWLARHLAWLGTLTAAAMILCAVAVWQAGVGGSIPSGSGPDVRVLTILWISLLSWYAVGQLASMTVRSGIMAGFLAIVVSALLALWLLIMAAWDLSPIIFVLPIAVGMLLATWLRAPDWLIERHSFQAWAKPVISVGLPMAVVLALVPAARLAQVDALFAHPPSAAAPTTAIGAEFALSDKDRLAARKTADDYLKLCYRIVYWTQVTRMVFPDLSPGTPLPPTADEEIAQRSLEENRDLLQPVIAISQRRLCRFPLMSITESDPSLGRFNDLMLLVKRSADALLAKGQLDESLDCYLAVLRMTNHARSGQMTYRWANPLLRSQTVDSIAQWGRHSNQTSHRLKDAIERLERVRADTPDPRTAIVADEVWLRDVIEERKMPSSLAKQGNSRYSPFVYAAYLANRLPWERTRAMRVLRGVTEIRLVTLSRILDLVETNDRQQLASTLNSLRWREPGGRSNWYYLRTDHLLGIEYRQTTNDFFAEVFVNDLTRQRGLMIGLALLAYRLEHASYPGQLDALVPEYLDQIPASPYSIGRFQYEPNGWDGRVEYHVSLPELDAHQPFLWSPGLNGPAVPTLTVSAVPSTPPQGDVTRDGESLPDLFAESEAAPESDGRTDDEEEESQGPPAHVDLPKIPPRDDTVARQSEEVLTYRLRFPVFVFPLPVADRATPPEPE